MHSSVDGVKLKSKIFILLLFESDDDISLFHSIHTHKHKVFGMVRRVVSHWRRIWMCKLHSICIQLMCFGLFVFFSDNFSKRLHTAQRRNEYQIVNCYGKCFLLFHPLFIFNLPQQIELHWVHDRRPSFWLIICFFQIYSLLLLLPWPMSRWIIFLMFDDST